MGSGVALGVDLGGTKTEVAVVDRTATELSVVLRERVPTPRDEGYEAIVASTAELVRAAATRASLDVAAVPIGVGMPGSVSRRTGLVKNSNTTCLNGRPFRQDLERALGRPVRFENDANCFALAEVRYGAARAYSDGIVFGVILGTGVGGGVVIRGRVHAGPQGIAGEWGHHGVWAGRPDARACYCGQRGCLERYASGPAVEDAYFAETGVRREASEIAALADAEPAAHRAMSDLVDAFGRGLANVIDVLDPDAVVLGGGLSNLAILYGAAREKTAEYVFSDELTTPIAKNQLGDSAGVIGAALLE